MLEGSHIIPGKEYNGIADAFNTIKKEENNEGFFKGVSGIFVSLAVSIFLEANFGFLKTTAQKGI